MQVTGGLASDLILGVLTFGFGSITSWLAWLTVRHFNYAKPAYEALAGSDLEDGHLDETTEKFDEIEDAHVDLRERVNGLEAKVDSVDSKTDRNYRLLERIANKAGVNTILFRGSGEEPDGGERSTGGD